MITTKGVKLLEGNIADVQESYKYLRIQQSNGNHEEVAVAEAVHKVAEGD